VTVRFPPASAACPKAGQGVRPRVRRPSRSSTRVSIGRAGSSYGSLTPFLFRSIQPWGRAQDDGAQSRRRRRRRLATAGRPSAAAVATGGAEEGNDQTGGYHGKGLEVVQSCRGYGWWSWKSRGQRGEIAAARPTSCGRPASRPKCGARLGRRANQARFWLNWRSPSSRPQLIQSRRSRALVLTPTAG